MRFSWPGLLVAPLAVPVLFSATVAGLTASGRPGLLCLFLLMASGVIFRGTTILLFLPSLFVLSAVRPVTWVAVCRLGLVLGGAADASLIWMAWKSGGPDSGPPEDSNLVFFMRWVTDPSALACPIAGVVTAGLYWGPGTWWPGRGDTPFAIGQVSTRGRPK